MIDISKLSSHYDVRRLTDADAEEVLALCRENTLFYEYSDAEPTREQVLRDMHITPPGTGAERKYFVGFYDGADLVAVMDLIDGYPTPETAYIGYFMMDVRSQGRQIGSAIVRGAEEYLRSVGMKTIRLGIDKGNPQSTHFWKKNGYAVIRETVKNGRASLEAEKVL